MAAVPAGVGAPEAAVPVGIGRMHSGVLVISVPEAAERGGGCACAGGGGGRVCAIGVGSTLCGGAGVWGRGQGRACGCVGCVAIIRDRRSRRHCNALEVLGDVGDAAFEGDLAFQRVAGDDVCFCADDVDDGVFFVVGEGGGRGGVGVVLAKLLQPDAHLVEGGCVCYVVAEEGGVGSAVCVLLLEVGEIE